MLKDIQQTNSTSEHFSEEVDTNLLEKFQRAIEQSGRLCSPKDEDYTVSFLKTFLSMSATIKIIYNFLKKSSHLLGFAQSE